MRKIKNFKLTWHPREVARRAKKAGLKPAELGLVGDEEWNAFLSEISRHFSHAVLFESFPSKSEAAALAPLPGLGCSLGLATLGPALDQALAAIPDPSRAKLAGIAAQTALDQALHFVGSLVAGEAEIEKCELSPLQPLTDPDALSSVIKILDGVKIGVSCSEGRLSPSFSAAFSVSWIAKHRSKSRR